MISLGNHFKQVFKKKEHLRINLHEKVKEEWIMKINLDHME